LITVIISVEEYNLWIPSLFSWGGGVAESV
jgi:hypothetical protein